MNVRPGRSPSPEVLIIRTGSANIASIIAAFRRIGVGAAVTEDPGSVASAEAVVLPGVGAFGPAMRGLRASSLDLAVKERIRRDRPLLCICLGLQLLCQDSCESPGERGLGIIPASVQPFPQSVRVPQMGWNTVSPTGGVSILEPGCAYFANSYFLRQVPAGWSGATAQHGGAFVAALERSSLLACQFHPELSGMYGQRLLGLWLARTGIAREMAC